MDDTPRCASPLGPSTEWQLNCVLGKGAYKVVYKAIDREEGYEVAWNCFQVRPFYRPSANNIAKTSKAEFNELSQEIEILKRVRHPNIINFHDCWFNAGEFVFVTELMTSGTLRECVFDMTGWTLTMADIYGSCMCRI
jgi:WNK lysine deficient protein kinase